MNRNLVFNIGIVSLFSVSILFLFLQKDADRKSLTASSFVNNSTIVIDAGHGGMDGGAVANGNILEKELNLEISKKLELIFNLCGFDTVMTRRDDNCYEAESSSIRQRKVADTRRRVELVAALPNATLISIHQNSFPQDPGCFGAQVFFSDNNINSKKLAERVQKALKRDIDNKNNRSEKVSDSGIYLLEKATCPAVLVECGFMTNGSELMQLTDSQFQKKLAFCIASGFVEYQNIK